MSRSHRRAAGAPTGDSTPWCRIEAANPQVASGLEAGGAAGARVSVHRFDGEVQNSSASAGSADQHLEAAA